MTETLRSAILFGLGAVYMTKEKVEKMVDDMVHKQNITPEEGKKLVQETLDKVEEYRKSRETEIRDTVKKVLDEIGVATKEDINGLREALRTPKQD